MNFQRFLLPLFLLLVSTVCFSQTNGFPYGQITYRELELTQYNADTAAVAVMLDEFGESYIDNDNDHNLIFEYHAKIKILKQAGVSYGTFEIPLRKVEGRTEKILTIKASSFNIENGSMRERKLDSKNVYSENQNKYYNATKFAIPNVKVGSVIDVYYKLESPFIYNFRTWEFQCEIPKVQSEYWALIPANYVYHISLTGFLTLTKNESERVKECFAPGGGMRADCSRLKYSIKDIPAFNEEDFMTAKSNFLSAINFELSQINYFDGRKDLITKEWKDADQELRLSSDFGLQIKRGKDIVSNDIDQLVGSMTDELSKAEKIYEFIKERYHWNRTYGKYSEFGIKKAFDSKTGNVGDINLSLIAALKYAGINVEPLVLSTRDNGLPSELYPVLSDFNYVIAKVNIADQVYLLDATDDYHPFGLIPLRCLNGKGRVLGEKESYWFELKPADRAKTITFINLMLDNNIFKGVIQYTYLGYEAVNQRRKLGSSASQEDYVNEMESQWNGIDIKSYAIENFEDPKKQLVIKLEVEAEIIDKLNDHDFLFNPFLIEQWKRNPFRSSERLYPVDFGAPLEEVMIFNLEYPSDYEIEGLPNKIGLALPQNGGRYTFEIKNFGNKLSMNNSLLIARPVFTSREYHYLKELFNNVIGAEQTQLVFKKKK
jgi:hypothetical protein